MPSSYSPLIKSLTTLSTYTHSFATLTSPFMRVCVYYFLPHHTHHLQGWLQQDRHVSAINIKSLPTQLLIIVWKITTTNSNSSGCNIHAPAAATAANRATAVAVSAAATVLPPYTTTIVHLYACKQSKPPDKQEVLFTVALWGTCWYAHASLQCSVRRVYRLCKRHPSNRRVVNNLFCTNIKWMSDLSFEKWFCHNKILSVS